MSLAQVTHSLAPREALARLRTEVLTRRFRYQNEKELQAGIHAVLKPNHFVKREVPLSKGGIIDFFLDDGIGIEVKIGGHWSEVLRQLMGYAEASEVRGLLLFTTKCRLDNMIPTELNRKPVQVASAGWSML